jgi:hypothetical protein
MISLNPNALARFEPGSSLPEADAMSTAAIFCVSLSFRLYLSTVVKPDAAIVQNLFKLIPASPSRVTSWFVFKPKSPIWVKFGRAKERKNVDISILCLFGIFYGHLV